MRKRLTLIFLSVLCFLSIFVLNINKVEAKDNFETSPYTTQIIGIGGKLVNSSTAYEGVDIINPGFNTPSDIFIDENDIVYVADKENKRIVLFYVGAGEPSDVMKSLSVMLPRYMIPAICKKLSAMPLTDNGKIDRRRLREQAETLE